LGEAIFAGMDGKEEDAPKPVIWLNAIEHRAPGSIPIQSGHGTRRSHQHLVSATSK
jgi:hypothetical protein